VSGFCTCGDNDSLTVRHNVCQVHVSEFPPRNGWRQETVVGEYVMVEVVFVNCIDLKQTTMADERHIVVIMHDVFMCVCLFYHYYRTMMAVLSGALVVQIRNNKRNAWRENATDKEDRMRDEECVLLMETVSGRC